MLKMEVNLEVIQSSARLHKAQLHLTLFKTASSQYILQFSNNFYHEENLLRLSILKSLLFGGP